MVRQNFCRKKLKILFFSQMQSAARSVADALVGYIDTYADHVNEQMTTEVTSCTQLKRIGENTHRVLCERVVNPQVPVDDFWKNLTEFYSECVLAIHGCLHSTGTSMFVDRPAVT
jgi:hypothetical protein